MCNLCIEALTGEQRVNAHAIFIAEPDVAEEMKTCMPAGHAHLVMDTTGRQEFFFGHVQDDTWTTVDARWLKMHVCSSLSFFFLICIYIYIYMCCLRNVCMITSYKRGFVGRRNCSPQH